MDIINNESKSMRFKPHNNRALGKYISTKAQYLEEMKKGGYEPYTPGAGEKVLKDSRKEYKPSQWAHDMANEIKRSTGKDGKVRLSSSAINSMKAHGVIFTDTNKKSNLDGRNPNQGGFK